MQFYEGVAKESFNLVNLDLLCNSVKPDNKAVFKRADGTWDQWTAWTCPACPTVGKKMRTRTCTGSMYSPPICPGFVGDKETSNEDCLIGNGVSMESLIVLYRHFNGNTILYSLFLVSTSVI